MDFEGTLYRDFRWLTAKLEKRAQLAACFGDLLDDYDTWQTTGRMPMNRQRCREWYIAKEKMDKFL
jgi:hypothetical protein